MPTIKHNYEKIKRNSICPCGESNKKYKHCCLKKIQAKEQQTYEMIHESKRIARVKKNVADAIQFDIDHPLILPDDNLCVPGNSGSNIILP